MTFSAAVGNATRLGAVSIGTAQNVTVSSGGLFATSLSETGGTGPGLKPVLLHS